AEKTIYQLPIIMVTSKNRIKDLIDGFEAGANDFITKPYNIYELITRINSAISLKNIFDDNTTLKEINKIKSDIVDMAVHDLKSPLTIISGYSKRIIKNCEKDQVAFENSNKILASSNKMLTIIDKLLTDSKFQNHIMDFQSHNINKLVEESINFYIDLANNKNQKIDYKYDDSINTILIDKNAFNTIIENLLSNAIKYSPINSIISIKIYNTEYDVCISIKDSGNGFTKEEMDNMFTKYFPYTNKPTKGENSTGIGLYIIKDMVNKNGGKILLNSERGQGSEFIIKFPKS
ncbi:MAG: response regulator, partial [Spirochaetales bacterium]|nr:response regulator [Spirochaetales bacterium]